MPTNDTNVGHQARLVASAALASFLLAPSPGEAQSILGQLQQQAVLPPPSMRTHHIISVAHGRIGVRRADIHQHGVTEATAHNDDEHVEPGEILVDRGQHVFFYWDFQEAWYLIAFVTPEEAETLDGRLPYLQQGLVPVAIKPGLYQHEQDPATGRPSITLNGAYISTEFHNNAFQIHDFADAGGPRGLLGWYSVPPEDALASGSLSYLHQHLTSHDPTERLTAARTVAEEIAGGGPAIAREFVPTLLILAKVDSNVEVRNEIIMRTLDDALSVLLQQEPLRQPSQFSYVGQPLKPLSGSDVSTIRAIITTMDEIRHDLNEQISTLVKQRLRRMNRNAPKLRQYVNAPHHPSDVN